MSDFISSENPAPTVSPTLHKSATLQDVADMANVTQMTVSNVLRDKGRVSQATREVVLDAARQLKYTPNPVAQRLVNGFDANHIDIFALKLDAGIGVVKIKQIQNELIRRCWRFRLC